LLSSDNDATPPQQEEGQQAQEESNDPFDYYYKEEKPENNSSATEQPRLEPTPVAERQEQVSTIQEEPSEIDKRIAQSQKVISELALQGSEIEKPIKPVRPKRPDVSHDPVDWSLEDSELYREYETDLEAYDEAKDTYFEQLSEYNASRVVSSLSEREAQVKKEEAQDLLFWDTNRKLQLEVPLLATSRDIADVHKDVTAFASRLASLHGITANDQDYSGKVSNVLGAYVNGDASVIANATKAGLQKPNDFDTYFEISDLHQQRAEGIESGLFGSNTPLSLVYTQKAMKNGTLASAQEKVNRATAQAIAESNRAVRTPSNSPYVENTQRSFDTALSNRVENEGLAKAGLTDSEMELYYQVEADPTLALEPSVGRKIDAIFDKIERAV
jgi:hypothetical protein